MSETNTELSTRSPFTTEELKALSSWEESAKLVQSKQLEIIDTHEVLGDGFDLVPTADKIKLVGVKFVILDWIYSQGAQGEFATMRIITEHNDKLIVNDGSTGIRDQLHNFDGMRGKGVIYCPNGLRVSEYDYTDEKTGKTSKARTFYLSA